MRLHLSSVLVAVTACAPTAAPPPASLPAPPVATPAPPPASAPAPAAAALTADTPETTVQGNTFVAPVGWTVTTAAPAVILEAPEAGSRIALVDVTADSAADAVARAWAAFEPGHAWPLKTTTTAADRDGWSKITAFGYQTSPNEKRTVAAVAELANGVWTVIIYDVADAVGEKRGAQVGAMLGKLRPKGYSDESFAGKTAHKLDAARIAELGKFVETAQQELGVPGVSIGLVQDGKVVFAGGFGVRALGQPAKVDGDTKYMIASNTKALTTLLLAKLVDEHKLGWDTPATQLLPTFKLGDADTTRQVQVKHLICACTGMPRQDLEWIIHFGGMTPARTLEVLGTMQPTSKFGELFQYSNPLAAAAGFIGGHVAFPKLELGAAYDQAMQTRVFGPLGMAQTTFDYKRAQTGNYAAPHAPDVDGKTAPALMTVNYSVIPARPAGAAWSNVRDVLKYVQMELAGGKLPGGKTYVSKDALLARQAAQVAVDSDTSYGMGLMVTTKYGVRVVHHGGDLVGFHSDMMWLPDHDVGAVVLTNGDPGSLIRTMFRRKLLEVLFDGRPEADAQVAAAGQAFFARLAAERKLMTVPADPAESAKLAPRYRNAALGAIVVHRTDGKTVLDVGDLKAEVASRRNPDGTTSFITIAPGLTGEELVVGGGPTPTLTLRDSQHEYVFTAE
jgi:CubicO group peptidase (beta-lactamase class C family)